MLAYQCLIRPFEINPSGDCPFKSDYYNNRRDSHDTHQNYMYYELLTECNNVGYDWSVVMPINYSL